MRRIKILSLLFWVIFFNQSSAAQEPRPDDRGYIVSVGDTVDDFQIRLLDGHCQMLADLKAKVIVLNFFASWCVVCQKEIPHIEQEIWQPLKDDGLIVLGVNYKEEESTVEKFIDKMNMTYPIVLDKNGKIFNKFARGGVTRNIVLDKNLNIIFLTRLFDPEEFQQMKNVIIQHLDSTKVSDKTERGKQMKKTILKDFANTDNKIELIYKGKHQIHLEGKILSADKKNLEIGITLFEEDIVSHKYEKKTRTFHIKYRHYEGPRIAILPMTKFTVAKDVQQIIVSDVE